MNEKKREGLEEIEKRLGAITPGPWEADREGLGVFTMYEGAMGGPICEVGDPYPRGYNNPRENMEFIAHAPEDIRALLTMAGAAQKRVGVLEAALREIQNAIRQDGSGKPSTVIYVAFEIAEAALAGKEGE